MSSPTDPEAMARRLRARLSSDGTVITHGEAREIVAATLGFHDWNTCVSATLPGPAPTTIPIVRTFPGPEARRFYLEFLGFSLDWEHRFDVGMPLYQQVSRAGSVLHLSEHHGDGTPGTAVRIQIADTLSLQRELLESTVYPLRIGLEHQPWGDDLVVPDPFGNRIIFHTPHQVAGAGGLAPDV